MVGKQWESGNHTKNTKGLRQSWMFFDPQPWPVYIAQEGEKIDFVGGMKLKSGVEMDRHSKSSGDR